MAVLLSNATAQRLLALLGDTRRDPLIPARQPPQRVAVASGREYPAPWTVRWSAAQDSYLVYIPAGAARVLLVVDDGASVAIVAGAVTIGLTAVAGLADWYTFTGAVGAVYARVSAGAITVGMSTAYSDRGALIASIAEDADAVTIKQIARSPLEFIIAAADSEAPPAADPENVPATCNQNIHPAENEPETQEEHPGDSDDSDDPHAGDESGSGEDSDDSDHPGAADCYTTR